MSLPHSPPSVKSRVRAHSVGPPRSNPGTLDPLDNLGTLGPRDKNRLQRTLRYRPIPEAAPAPTPAVTGEKRLLMNQTLLA